MRDSYHVPPPDESIAPRAVVGVATGIALIALVVLTAYRHYAILDATPYAVGVDGYYYPLQLRSILEHGTLAYRDFPLAFYLMAPFAVATDPIVGAKLGAAILGAFAILPAYAIGARLGKSRGAGLVAAALLATSAGSSFLAFEFVKNGVGVTMALLAVWLGLRACQSVSRQRVVVAVIAVLAALATHKVAGALVLVVAAPAGIATASERGALFGRRLLYAIIGIAVAAIGGVVAAGAEGLVTNLFSSDMRLGAPALAQGDATILSMGHEALIALVLAALTAIALLTRKTAKLSRNERAAAWALVVLGLLIGQPWLAVDDAQELGFRLRVIAFVPMCLLAAILAGAIPAIVRGAIPVGLAIAIVLLVPARRTEGMVVPHPAMVTSVMALHVPAGATVIIPERQLVFMAAYYTRLPTRLEPVAIPPSQRWRAVTLAFIQAYCPIEPALAVARSHSDPPIGLHPTHANGFVLMSEATWTQVIAQLSPHAQQRCAAWPTI